MQRGRTIRQFTAAIACGILFLTPVNGFPGDQPLKDTLELRILQTGFAGVTGTIYRIEPSGAFVAKTLINDVEGDVVKSGQLDLAAMIAISENLNAVRLEELPERSEIYAGINPALIDVRYGDLVRVLSLPPGQPSAAACGTDRSDMVCRVLGLSDSVAKPIESFSD
jgi:hypothetical protein